MNYIIRTRTWTFNCGCSKLVDFTDSRSLWNVLDKLYYQCQETTDRKRAFEVSFNGAYAKVPHITFKLQNGFEGVVENIVVEDNKKKVMIYDNFKYCSPKCFSTLKEIKEMQEEVEQPIPYGEI